MAVIKFYMRLSLANKKTKLVNQMMRNYEVIMQEKPVMFLQNNQVGLTPNFWIVSGVSMIPYEEVCMSSYYVYMYTLYSSSNF